MMLLGILLVLLGMVGLYRLTKQEFKVIACVFIILGIISFTKSVYVESASRAKVVSEDNGRRERVLIASALQIETMKLKLHKIKKEHDTLVVKTSVLRFPLARLAKIDNLDTVQKRKDKLIIRLNEEIFEKVGRIKELEIATIESDFPIKRWKVSIRSKSTSLNYHQWIEAKLKESIAIEYDRLNLEVHVASLLRVRDRSNSSGMIEFALKGGKRIKLYEVDNGDTLKVYFQSVWFYFVVKKFGNQVILHPFHKEGVPNLKIKYVVSDY